MTCLQSKPMKSPVWLVLRSEEHSDLRYQFTTPTLASLVRWCGLGHPVDRMQSWYDGSSRVADLPVYRGIHALIPGPVLDHTARQSVRGIGAYRWITILAGGSLPWELTACLVGPPACGCSLSSLSLKLSENGGQTHRCVPSHSCPSHASPSAAQM